MIKTCDPDVVILEQSIGNEDPNNDYIIYASKKEKWIIKGRCNLCGLCEVGSVTKDRIQFNSKIKIGEENACIDITFKSRLDVPVKPEITEEAIKQRDDMIKAGRKDVSPNGKCTLTGNYL